jgi:ABC-2 type transport system permease protein
VSTVVLFGLFGVVVGFLFSQAAGSDSTGAAGPGLAGAMMFLLSFVLPPVAVLVSSDAIARKRSRGTMRVILGLPFSRFDVVFTMFLGRLLVVTAGLIACFGLATLVVQTQGVTIDINQVVGFIGIVILFAASFVSIGIALSAQTGSIIRVVAAGTGIAAVFSLRIDNQLIVPNELVPGLAALVLPRTPVNALELADTIYDPAVGELAIGPLTPGDVGSPTEPFLVLLGWIIIPLLLGYARFSRQDL